MKTRSLRNLPRSVKALCWVLAAFHTWGFEGVTQRALMGLLNIESKDGVRALVRRAQKERVITVRYVKERPVIALKTETLHSLRRETGN